MSTETRKVLITPASMIRADNLVGCDVCAAPPVPIAAGGDALVHTPDCTSIWCDGLAIGWHRLRERDRLERRVDDSIAVLDEAGVGTDRTELEILVRGGVSWCDFAAAVKISTHWPIVRVQALTHRAGRADATLATPAEVIA